MDDIYEYINHGTFGAPPDLINFIGKQSKSGGSNCPLGAKGALDVGFHVIEETAPGTVLEVRFAAPDGIKGWVVFDVGLVET